MLPYEKKLFWEIRLQILSIPRSLRCVSVKITEQWTEFDKQYFLFYLFPADEHFPSLLKTVNTCNTLSCMWYKHLLIMWHSCLPSERKNNNPCNFKDMRKCQSCKNLANSFTFWKLSDTREESLRDTLSRQSWVYHVNLSRCRKMFSSVPIQCSFLRQ